MADESPLFPLAGALQDLMLWLGDTQTKGVVVGSVASSILGRPRMTRDVDVLVLVEDAQRSAFVACAGRHNIGPRRQDVLEFARRSRVLLMKHLPSDINVDVILGMIPFERQLIERASEVCLGDVRIPVPTPEDMIIMKAIARRPQDLEDIRGIVDTNESLDRDYIRSAVSEFAIDMGVPEIATDLEGLL